ncbi:MAG: carboxypeptidase regulatory-like domain-containing protein [Planctomycetes bacterium]|nr:carboxypeptidase regulatory-like domain-containing protein [Planctomycetota bacterium]
MIRALLLVLSAACATCAVASWDAVIEAESADGPASAGPVEPPPPVEAAAPALLGLRAAPSSDAAGTPPADPPPKVEIEPTEEEVPARVLPMRVAILDAETGAEVHGARWGFAAEPSGSAGADVVPVPRRVAADEALDVACRPPDETTLVRCDALPGGQGFGPGFVDEEFVHGVRVSRYATALCAVVPMRREALMWLRVFEPDGLTPARSHTTEVSAGGRELLTGGGASTDGRPILMRGVPFQRGEPWRVIATGPHGSTTVEGRFGKDPGTAVVVEAVLPAPSGLGSVKRHRSLRCGSGCSGRLVLEDDDAPRGDVRLHVLRRDGRPAAGATVRLEFVGEAVAPCVPDDVVVTLDDAGRATVRDLVVGPWRATLREVGLVPTARTLAVVAHETVDVDVAEAAGGAVDVLVVDADGDPLPFAQVELAQQSRIPWVELEDGVQRLDGCVDARGRRVFRGVEPGHVELSVRFGSRRERASVDVDEGGVARVQVALR